MRSIFISRIFWCALLTLISMQVWAVTNTEMQGNTSVNTNATMRNNAINNQSTIMTDDELKAKGKNAQVSPSVSGRAASPSVGGAVPSTETTIDANGKASTNTQQ